VEAWAPQETSGKEASSQQFPFREMPRLFNLVQHRRIWCLSILPGEASADLRGSTCLPAPAVAVGNGTVLGRVWGVFLSSSQQGSRDLYESKKTTQRSLCEGLTTRYVCPACQWEDLVGGSTGSFPKTKGESKLSQSFCAYGGSHWQHGKQRMSIW